MKLTAEPQLFVTDMQAALQHYADSLGFTVAFVWGEPPFYAQVVRDGAKLNLRHVDGPVFSDALRQTEGDVLSATVTTDDVEGLYAESPTWAWPSIRPCGWSHGAHGPSSSPIRPET